MSYSRTQKMVVVAVLGALALVVQFFSFPVIPAAPFLKVDFSDLVILLAMIIFSWKEGVLVTFIRSFLHYLLTGGEVGVPVGDFAAFLGSLALTLPVYFIIRKYGIHLKSSLLAIFTGTLSLTLVLSLTNWLILAPAYMALMNFDVGPMREYLTISVIPFNLIKGVLVISASLLVIKAMKAFLPSLAKEK